MGDRRSSLDLLPDAGIPALQTAYDQLKARRVEQSVAYEQLHRALDQLAIPVPSFSAFNRWAIKIREQNLARPVMMGQPANISAEVARQLRALADEVERKAAAEY